jgi:hypothetical protein
MSDVPQFDRHPDLQKILAGREDQPYTYIFTGKKWPSSIRRRRLISVSEDAESSTTELFHLDGAGLFIERTIDSVSGEFLCKAYTSSGHEGTRRSIAERSCSSTSSTSSTGSAFETSYLLSTVVELAARGDHYRCCVRSAWSKWPGFVDIERRRSIVDVIDDLIHFFGGRASTTHVAVHYLDKFLELASPDVISATRSTLRMLVCAAVLVACKNVDVVVPSLKGLADVMEQWDRERPRTSSIADMEMLLLTTLHFKLQPPTLRDHVGVRLAMDEVPQGHRQADEAFWLADVMLRSPESDDPQLLAQRILAVVGGVADEEIDRLALVYEGSKASVARRRPL